MRIHTLYFSPTGTTKKIVAAIAGRLAGELGLGPAAPVDITPPGARAQPPSFSEGDLVVAGVPVYAGRVPNVMVKFLNTVRGSGALAVATVVYGNRHYDDALIEFADILSSDGFQVIAGGAFVGEHSFSTVLGGGRPDARDLSAAEEFARQISRKLAGQKEWEPLAVPGSRPYRPYYMPKDKDGNPAPIQKVVPRTSGECTDCKLCAELCPLGSIDYDDVTRLNGICIKCCACVKGCPVGAKYFDDPKYLWHKQELEENYASARREPEYFL